MSASVSLLRDKVLPVAEAALSDLTEEELLLDVSIDVSHIQVGPPNSEGWAHCQSIIVANLWFMVPGRGDGEPNVAGRAQIPIQEVNDDTVAWAVRESWNHLMLDRLDAQMERHASDQGFNWDSFFAPRALPPGTGLGLVDPDEEED